MERRPQAAALLEQARPNLFSIAVANIRSYAINTVPEHTFALILACAKGITSAYAPMGALLISDRVADGLLDAERMFTHGVTFGGHPVAAAVALKNIEIMERLDVLGNVRANEAYLRDALLGLKERHHLIGDVRGAGYFWAMELVRDQATRETFTPEECDVLLRDFLSPELFKRGLLCRADDRGDPVIQISPPLICGREEIDAAVAVFDEVLPLASARMGTPGP